MSTNAFDELKESMSAWICIHVSACMSSTTPSLIIVIKQTIQYIYEREREEKKESIHHVTSSEFFAACYTCQSVFEELHNGSSIELTLIYSFHHLEGTRLLREDKFYVITCHFSALIRGDRISSVMNSYSTQLISLYSRKRLDERQT